MLMSGLTNGLKHGMGEHSEEQNQFQNRERPKLLRVRLAALTPVVNIPIDTLHFRTTTVHKKRKVICPETTLSVTLRNL